MRTGMLSVTLYWMSNETLTQEWKFYKRTSIMYSYDLVSKQNIFSGHRWSGYKPSNRTTQSKESSHINTVLFTKVYLYTNPFRPGAHLKQHRAQLRHDKPPEHDASPPQYIPYKCWRKMNSQSCSSHLPANGYFKNGALGHNWSESLWDRADLKYSAFTGGMAVPL